MRLFTASATPRHLISPDVSNLGLGTNFKIRPRVSFVLVNKDRVFGCKELKETRTRSGFSFEGYSDIGAEWILERELLMFMKNSKNPNAFPTKKELYAAGRDDLVNAISETGGWLALGWDCSDDEHDFENNDVDDTTELRTRLESFQQRQDVYEPSSSFLTSPHQSPSPSGRSLETVGDEDTGIEGILSRLKKHRNLSFDVHNEKNIHGTYASSKNNGSLKDSGNSTTPGSWTIPRKHFSNFQAAEIDYGKDESKDKRTLSINKEVNADHIRSRLEQMKLELSSTLDSLRSTSQTLDSKVKKVQETGSSELQNLSDAWEFQENEVMKAKDKLRSIRAKLAVFEGKMALSVIDTHKLVEEKQRRIDSARRTLQVLRTTYVYWTHSASEVLLVGSFDGWTSQIKMEKTRTGIFSASLKLYPGKYEIKFIVDGIWKIDPMLTVVHNNGYENNRIIVHERSV